MGLLDNIKKVFQTETKPNFNELAISTDQMYKDGDIIPYNPDTLVGRKGFYMYDQMRIDDQVKACLTLKKFATLAPSYQIIPASDDEQDIEIAEFVEYCFEKMQGNLTDSILEIMTALDYGFSISEINYKTFDSGVHQGKIGIKNIKTKKPHYYNFAVDEFSNLLPNGIQYNQSGKDVRYPINKFIIFSYNKEFGNHYGTSDLRPAYRGYWSKDVLIKMWNIYLERFANPTAIGKYKANDPNARNNLRNILNNISANTNITHREGEYDIQFLESNRNATGDFETALNFYNKAIARSILIPDRLMAEGDTGAYAQAKIHFDVFLFVISKLRLDIEDNVMGEQLIRRLVAYNYSNVETLPHFKFNPMTDEQKMALNAMFVDAVMKGVIAPTIDDENQLRNSLNFPEKDVEPDTPDREVDEETDEEEIEEISNNKQYQSKRDAGLRNKVDKHNEKYGNTKTKKATLRMLKAVYDRGIGAYRTNPQSVRPSVKSKEQWAMARVNSFLSALRTGRFRSGKHDQDLFPKGHPLSSKKNSYEEYEADIDRTPTNAMVEEAKRGLEWRRERPTGAKAGTDIGVARARDIANKKKLSDRTILRMHSYFSRHEVDKKGKGFSPGEEGYPSPGRIAWALWGGDAGQSWARTRRNQIMRQRNQSKEYAYQKSSDEKRVDFNKVENDLDNLENTFLDKSRAVLGRQKDSVIQYVQNKIKGGNFDFKAVDNLQLKYKGDLQNAFRDVYDESFTFGARQARKEIPKKFVKANVGEGLQVGDLKRYLESKARFDVRELEARLGASLTTVLLDGIKSGKSASEITKEIEKVFNPYTATGTTMVGDKVIEAYNMRTIARTATLGAYNFGRRSIGEDKDLEGFVLGYRLSPVLDERTSDICQFVGRNPIIIRIEDKENISRLTPPLHYNCRTIMVFITPDDEPVPFTNESILGELKGMTQIT